MWFILLLIVVALVGGTIVFTWNALVLVFLLSIPVFVSLLAGGVFGGIASIRVNKKSDKYIFFPFALLIGGFIGWIGYDIASHIVTMVLTGVIPEPFGARLQYVSAIICAYVFWWDFNDCVSEKYIRQEIEKHNIQGPLLWK